MTFLVIKVVEIEADSVNEAADRAMEVEARGEVATFVQVKNSVTVAAVETALIGATEAIA